jgi:hypothetical protein
MIARIGSGRVGRGLTVIQGSGTLEDCAAQWQTVAVSLLAPGNLSHSATIYGVSQEMVGPDLIS